MALYEHNTGSIPGTVIFDGKEAMKAYAINKMCFSFNEEKNRQAFLEDEEAYCDKFGLTDDQKELIRNRDVLGLVEGGGNIYYLAKFTGIFKLSVQDIGAMQTGMSLDDFKAKLVAYAEGQE